MNWRDKNLEDFERTWEEQIQRIREQPIDSRGARLIYLEFHINRGLLRFNRIGQEGAQNYQRLRNLETKLTVAVETSRSNYSLQNLSTWGRISESLTKVLDSILEIVRALKS